MTSFYGELVLVLLIEAPLSQDLDALLRVGISCKTCYKSLVRSGLVVLLTGFPPLLILLLYDR